MIIGVSGYARSGKDAFSDFLVNDFGFERVTFAGKMKEAAAAIDPLIGYMPGISPGEGYPLRLSHLLMNGWEKAKEHPEVRRFLQRLGTEAGRNVFGENFWVDLALGDMIPGRDYVVTDVRFPNEAKAIVDSGGAVVRITRPNVGPANDHPSETAIDNWGFDFVVSNDRTLEDLRQVASDVFAAMDPVVGYV